MIQVAAPALVLASGSASRRALLQAAGLAFTVRPVDLDETVIKRQAAVAGEDATAAALRLAHAKAALVIEAGAIVIGGDQILVCDKRWFDKPRDLGDAVAHLRALRGRSHSLATAVCCWRNGAPVWSHVASPCLTMRDLSDRFIEAYIAIEGLRCLDTVGAYRLEGPGIQLFGAIQGEHSAILGLPMLPLLAFLRDQGVIAA